MTVRSRLSIYVAVLTFIFLISPGPTLAEPSLGLSPQSNAHYQLIAEYRTIQSCSASPSNYTFIACGQQSGLHPTTSNVNVTDDGKCLPNTAACSFVPASVTVNQGDSIEWHNVGSLNHTVIFDSGGFSSIFLVNSSLPFKTSQPFSSVGFQRFDASGTFTYHDQRSSWMTGTITVNSLRSVPPRVQETNTTGPVGWTVIGLDDNVVLSFNHALATTTNSTGSTKTTTNESGTFEEIVNLSTRKETPGVASSFRYIPPIFLSGQGFGQIGGGYYPYYYYPPQDVYTIWWVNGPLNLGSSVELLTSTAAVTGSNSFQVSGAKYTTWTVQSNYLEAYNQTQPGSQQIFPVGPPFPVVGPGGFYPGYPSYFTAGYSDSVSIAFEYGQKSDLLFSAAADTRNYDKQVTVYPPGSPIYNYYGGFSILAAHGANVTNTYDTTSTISLKLQTTNLDLTQRTTPPPTGGGGTQSPSVNLPSSMTPWLYTAIGAVAAAGVAGAVWAGTRNRKRTPTALQGPLNITPAV